jgi:nucleotide-binding universal stress UspA family protein
MHHSSDSRRPREATREVSISAHPTTIVCGLDGSAGCVEVSRIATTLAEALSARVELVHVLDGGPRANGAIPMTDLRMRAQAMLDGMSDSSETIASGRLVESGDPARRIAAIADSERAGLIIVGTRGNAPVADALLGSVSSRLAADAPCPVLIVPPHLQAHVRPERWPARTIICGYDGSEGGWNAALASGALAARLGSGVRLVSVGTGNSWSVGEAAARLEECLERHSQPGEAPDVTWEVRSGDPVWELERVARALTAPLLAIGSRGLGPWTDPLIGSVARRVLLGARRPILVCPATSVAGL